MAAEGEGGGGGGRCCCGRVGTNSGACALSLLKDSFRESDGSDEEEGKEEED